MSKQLNNNIVSLDILRGLAASFVFFYHMHIGGLLHKATGINLFNYIDLIGAQYAVPIFFILSGYCIELSVQNTISRKGSFQIKEFYIRRLKRIYIPYLFALFFSILANYIAKSNYSLEIQDFIIHLFVFQGFSNTYFNTINVVLWTITVELAFYLLYPVYFYLKQRSGLFNTLAILSIVSLVSIIITSYLKQNGGLAYHYFPINLFASWCLGCALCNLKTTEPFLKKFIYAFVLVSVPFILLSIFYKGAEIISIYNLRIIGSGILLLLFLSADKLIKKLPNLFKPLQLIGLSSYSLYLLHEPLILLKGYAVNNLFNGSNKNISHIVGIFIIFFLCHIAYLYIEKPILNKNKHSSKTI